MTFVETGMRFVGTAAEARRASPVVEPAAGAAPPRDEPIVGPEAPPHPAITPAPCEGGAGTAPGINIAPGSDDDGWVVPDPVTLADGTRVQLYKDGEALRAAHTAILAARRRICLEVYIFADDDTGHAFAEALCRKARDGVHVYVIYDSFGSRGFFGDEPEMFKEMRRNGVRLQQFHPMRPWECQYSWRPANRDHRKLLVVDHEIAGLGGVNIGTEYGGSWVARAVKAVTKTKAGKAVTKGLVKIGSTHRARAGLESAIGSYGAGCDYWRDNAVGIRGPGAAAFQRAFNATWHYVTHGGPARRAEFQHGSESGDLGILASVPSMNSPLRPRIGRFIRSARTSLLMTMAYFVPDDELVGELCKAARRGVRVRLMLPGRCDVPAVRLAARSFYQRLLGCGVEVYERQGAVLHAKTMVADGHTSVIGSTNLDSRSIEYNLEISAVIRSDAFGRQMHELFENDVRYARRITIAEWRRLPRWDRVAQWAVSRARYLM